MLCTHWHKPIAYRMGNTTIRLQARFLCLVSVVGCIAFIVFVLKFKLPLTSICYPQLSQVPYNDTYPLTPPRVTDNTYKFKIAVVADLDTLSKSQDEANVWKSYLKYGELTYSAKDGSVSVDWESQALTLKSSMASGGRGMELSELVTFNGLLYSVDDRTGIVYEIRDNKAVPWVILTDGDGHVAKGFKCEWATVKDGLLYVGGLGKEWTNGQGDVLNLNPQWVKIISPTGQVSHVDWHQTYEKIKEKTGISSPGYVIHEAVVWSSVHRKWFFLPRRASKSRYNEVEDEEHGTNLVISCDEQFQDVGVLTVGAVVPSHGFSSFKFVPGTKDQVIVALKTEEDHGTIRSYILAFNIRGEMITGETDIGSVKYEGIEFC